MRSGEVGWARGEQARLVSAAVCCIAKPVSSICTLIRGGKNLLFLIRLGMKAVVRNL